MTGEKINKLRKSYEGKAKNLGIDGRNKASVQEGHLVGLVDPLWDSLVSGSTSMWDAKMEGSALDGPTTNTMVGGLGRAFGFKAGRLPKAEHAEWTQQLGLDDAPVAAKAPPAKAAPPKAPTPTVVSKTAPPTASRASVPSSPRAAGGRPERAGKKRRYDESSYEGYDDDGYSTGGVDESGRRTSGTKRVKRKVSGR